jgi:DNA-binding PucR family transcriptional regulator
MARTLETYLDCSGVARHAAKALFLHPHSLRYRLRRIGEIQGIDLTDPMERLSTHLALKLRVLMGQTEEGDSLRATGA